MGEWFGEHQESVAYSYSNSHSTDHAHAIEHEHSRSRLVTTKHGILTQPIIPYLIATDNRLQGLGLTLLAVDSVERADINKRPITLCAGYPGIENAPNPSSQR